MSQVHHTPDLGDRIAHRLKVKGWTPVQLAERIGCSPETVRKAIKNHKIHSSHRMRLFAWHLDTTVDWLLGVTKFNTESLETCQKSFCGERAKWAVIRQGQHESMASKSCDNCLSYHVSKDRSTTIMPLQQYLKTEPRRGKQTPPLARVEVVKHG